MSYLRSLACALALLVFGATAQAAPVRQDVALKAVDSQVVLAKADDKKKAAKKRAAKKKVVKRRAAKKKLAKKAAKKKAAKRKKVVKKKPAKS